MCGFSEAAPHCRSHHEKGPVQSQVGKMIYSTCSSTNALKMSVQVGLLGMKQEPHPTHKEHSWFNLHCSRTVVHVCVWVAAAVHRKHQCSPAFLQVTVRSVCREAVTLLLRTHHPGTAPMPTVSKVLARTDLRQREFSPPLLSPSPLI